MLIRDIQINNLHHFIGIRPDKLFLTWKVDDCLKQNAFQIKILINNQVVEDSNKITSSETFYAIKNSLGYKVKATIEIHCFDEEDKEAISIVEVTTGKDKDDFKAKWINPELTPLKKDEVQLGAYLKKEFTLDKLPKNEAILYATSHGIMNIYINGQEVSENFLMPGTQQYDKRLMVETLIVTPFLKKGKNEIIVSLGNGWYRGSIGNDHNHNIYGNDIAFLGELEIDGKTALISDNTWLGCNDGPLGKNDLMSGEDYDASKVKTMVYHPVKEENFGYSNLICVDAEPILKHEKYLAKAIKVPNNETVYDFGVNIAGIVEFNISGHDGDKLIIEHGEVLDKDGNFTQVNFQGRKINHQKIEYTCKEGNNTFHPTKTYYGFRYIKVSGNVKTSPKNFVAYALYSDIKQVGTFECGNNDINQLFNNALVSMKANFIDVPTDCPTREKSGFSGDAQAFVDSATYLMDCASVYNKWMAENRAGQFKDGTLPQVSPKIFTPSKKNKMMGIMSLDGGVGWSDALEIIALKLYERYQNKAMLEDNYLAIKKWVDFEIKKARSTRLSNYKLLPKQYRKYMIDKGWMWGEWLEPGQNDVNYMKNLVFHGDAEVGTAFLYLNCAYLEKIANILSKKDDEKKYGDYKQKVKEAYRAVYTNNGSITDPVRQCRYVRPIAHDLLTEEEKKKAVKDLSSLIEKNNNHLNTGFLTSHDLGKVLFDYGAASKGYDLLLQNTYPSWLYAVNKGCTSIPENWNCFKDDGTPYNSFSHYSYGAIAGTMIDSILGIKVKNGNIIIKPNVDQRIKYAKGSYDSPLGLISSSWEINNNKTHYEFIIPSNARATIIIDDKIMNVTTGKYTFNF